MDSSVLAAYQFAQELTKQLLTLSTGIIALSVTFTKEFVTSSPARNALLVSVWIFLLFSIGGGVLHLMALTGALAGETPPTGILDNARVMACLQVVGFFLGMFAMVAYGLVAVWDRGTRSKEAAVREETES
ncbi:MAG: hypothetical protein KY459_11930 [Acidobacteria bacterium]|nr:hypothetical protein [Acidobacteriota bacterium]